MIPGRIRNGNSYRDGQPDLDIYAECWEPYVSRGFAASDVDGLVVCTGQPHGLVERRGYWVMLEHKAGPGCWAKARGQWIALNVVAESVESMPSGWVVVTYGPTDNPTGYQRLPARNWNKLRTEEDFRGMEVQPQDMAKPETTWARRWISWVASR